MNAGDRQTAQVQCGLLFLTICIIFGTSIDGIQKQGQSWNRIGAYAAFRPWLKHSLYITLQSTILNSKFIHHDNGGKQKMTLERQSDLWRQSATPRKL